MTLANPMKSSVYCLIFFDSHFAISQFKKKKHKHTKQQKKKNATRELFEELGIKDAPMKFFGEFKYCDDKSKVWGHLWHCIYDGFVVSLLYCVCCIFFLCVFVFVAFFANKNKQSNQQFWKNVTFVFCFF